MNYNSTSENLTFEDWFNIFNAVCREEGYYGTLDASQFESDYDNNISAELSAAYFLSENLEFDEDYDEDDICW